MKSTYSTDLESLIGAKSEDKGDDKGGKDDKGGEDDSKSSKFKTESFPEYLANKDAMTIQEI